MFRKNSDKEFEEIYEDGAILVQEGNECREMFIIQKGEVSITKRIGDRDVELCRLGRGSFIGEMSLLESMPRSATVRSIGTTKVLVIKLGALLLRLRRDPTFAFEMLQQMSRRLRSIDRRLVQLMTSGEMSPEARREIERTRAETDLTLPD